MRRSLCSGVTGSRRRISIGIIYETGNTYDGIVESYAKLSFARFNLEWLTDGKDAGPKR